MSCRDDHAIGAFVVVAMGHAVLQARRPGRLGGDPLLSGLMGALLGSLPDVLEPAHHPHHRQFFHSATFAAAVAYALKRLDGWETVEPTGQILRALAMIGSAAYLSHLVMDATTPRSIPLLALR